MGIGEFSASLAERGLKRRKRGAERGEGGFRGFEGRELAEEVLVAGEDLVAELGIEETKAFLELFNTGGSGAGG